MSSHDAKPTLASARPEIAEQWHPTLNGELTPDQVAPSSGKKPWWQCEQGHEWDATVANRTRRNDGCPYCSGRRIIPGFNDLATLHPSLAAQWHPTLNGNLDPTTIAPKHNKKVWWLCPVCSHEWSALIPNRHKRGCPACAGRAVRVGFNDLLTTYPQLAVEWHPALNGDLTPQQVSAGQAVEPWWQCAEGHEWTAPLYARANAAQGCPYCSGREVVLGLNGVTQTHPHLVTEWDSEKNTKTPDEVKAGSAQRIWWRCGQGHSWATPVKYRTSFATPTGCPTCAAAATSSRGEQEVADYIESLGLAIHRNTRSIIRQELDIYIPSKGVAIEYNGIYWHSEMAGKTRLFHFNKWQACKDQGIQLIQVWEDEWRRNPEQVKRMLAHKLGISYGDEERVMARKTHAITITKVQAERFLNTHHVQRHANGTYYLALVKKDIPQTTYDSDDLLAVLVLKQERFKDGIALNIIRYATSAVIPGGFTKLLTHAERTYAPDKFITFSDNCVSDGGLYENNGFVADKPLPPDYMYVVRNERRHKFGYRLKRFRNDPELLWEEGLTERELAILNGLHRIWDAGKTRWVKTVTHNRVPGAQ